jgi:hypothetical protein
VNEEAAAAVVVVVVDIQHKNKPIDQFGKNTSTFKRYPLPKN